MSTEPPLVTNHPTLHKITSSCFFYLGVPIIIGLAVFFGISIFFPQLSPMLKIIVTGLAAGASFEFASQIARHYSPYYVFTDGKKE